MLIRLPLTTPHYDFDFQIHNGSAQRQFTWWQFYAPFEAATMLHDMELSGHPHLNEVLRLAGPHSKLWIGDWCGTVAPMDSEPQGWTYPSGKPLEPEWWWQWHPDQRSEATMRSILNANPIEAWSIDSPWKAGVPFQVQRSTGGVASIYAIPMMRLPGMVRKETDWIFEFERN